jgi:Peptidase family M28/WD40-like Beta Propeller Repeat
MSRRLIPLAAVLALVTLTLGFGSSMLARQTAAPATPEARWQRAMDAWEAGQYPAALEDLRALAASPAARDYFDRVALLTGELFVTTELTTDGRSPAISADGRYAAYETGPTGSAVTRLVRLTASGVETLGELAAAGVVFSRGDARIAYVERPSTPEYAAALQAIDRAASGAERQAAQAAASWLEATQGQLRVRDLATGAETTLATPGLLKSNPAWAARDRGVVFLGADASDLSRTDFYLASPSAAPVRLTDEPGFKTNVMVDPSGKALVYQTANFPAFRDPATAPVAGGGRGAGRGGRGGGGGRGGAPASYVVVDLSTRTARPLSGSGLTMSADGSTLAWFLRSDDSYTLSASGTLASDATTIRTGRDRIDAPALSPDGRQVAYQVMTNTDWEIYVSDLAGHERRLTRDIQHDLLPRFLTNDTLLGMMGEARHRRSQLYDLTTGSRTRLFANNTIRTISPEYVWVPSADGKHLAVQAERDGDTVSPERGVYVVDLTRRITAADLTSRLNRQLAEETDLRQRMTRAFQPIADLVRRTLAGAAVNHVYEYEKTLFDFDSKYVSQPGNARAIDYLTRTYTSFGYQPDLQWFEPQQAQGNRTANIVSIKRGTENPDLLYVVSSHFDSVVVGPGADDDTSGTAALLETARMLADVPLPATVVFASFTGEEGGLLGSREFVRRAAENKWNIVGALNNDMIGWGGESARMDNTIRYSNAGIKDLQHGAAFLFTDLITYDARYYKGTDAQAFYDGWGDIVGGLGSYPVLANPNYHQPTDLIETINFRQIMETAKVTAATLIYLASSPSRIKDVAATRSAGGTTVSWTASPEQGVARYLVAYGPGADPLRTTVTVTGPRATLPALPAGTQIAVKAENARGLQGWDWARTVLQ